MKRINLDKKNQNVACNILYITFIHNNDIIFISKYK